MVFYTCPTSLLLLLHLAALAPLVFVQGQAHESVDGSLDPLLSADDECPPSAAESGAADQDRLACALSALQRRGQKTLRDSRSQEAQEAEEEEEAEAEEEDDSFAEEREEESSEAGRRRRRRRRRRSAPIVKGISYGPIPCKSTNCDISMDDFMGDAAKPMWGPRGRADLNTIRLLGANHVRLYGNAPETDHSPFLDEAHAQKLKVVVGMSDYPYTQMQGNCMHSGYDCYELLKAEYRMNLLNGFVQNEAVLPSKSYHPALSTVIVVNEPDLKLPGIFEPRRFVKAIISALDGMLDAEKEVGVTGNFVNFTATCSFGICSHCKEFTNKPALGQMAEIEDGLLHPEAYGYTPKNDLTKIYYTRWIHSFNTAAPAKFIRTDFLSVYEQRFVSTPVVIMEYHTPFKNVYKDLGAILAVARNSSLLQGASFFQFQVSYSKGGSEEEFGMFGLGDYNLGSFDYYGTSFGDWCLKPVTTEFGTMPANVAKAMGGPGLDWDTLCIPDPAKVSVDAAGYAQIASQGPQRVATFIGRIVAHLGGTVLDTSGLEHFAADVATQSMDAAQQFGEIVGRLTSPAGLASGWFRLDPHAKCVADRAADAGSVGQAVGSACGKATTFNCTDLPLMCKGSVWATADWVFNAYYSEIKEDPLVNCYFGGSAVLATADYPARRCGQECCGYSGAAPLAPTVPPTLPPIFDPDGGKTTTSGPPTPSPEIAGDCHFKHVPTIHYFWDPNCLPRGGPGCNADGKHMQCRFCGTGPFPSCPTSPVKLRAPMGPTPSPAPSPEIAGDCSFGAQKPALPYFWDSACLPQGGPGCMADGRHLECRLCGQAPYPSCPS